jgi:hypothetical protein
MTSNHLVLYMDLTSAFLILTLVFSDTFFRTMFIVASIVYFVMGIIHYKNHIHKKTLT